MKLTGDARRDNGRALFTRMLGYMLKDISHPEMSSLADWALDETGCLHTSQLSHLRNQKMRMLGVKSLDALGRINVAGQLFKDGDRKALKELGTGTITAKVEEILSRYEPILNESGEAMDAGDFMMIYLGYIDLPIFDGEDAGKDWVKAAANLGEWLEQLLEEREIRTRDALPMIKKAWTGNDETRDKFCLVVAGIESFSDTELPAVWPAITAAVAPILDESISEDDLFDMVIA